MFGRIGDRRRLVTRTASPPPSFPVTGSSYTGYGIHFQHRGTGDIDLTDVTLTTTGAAARYRRGHTVSKAGIHTKDTDVGDIVVNFRSGAIRTIGVTGRSLQIEQGKNADADGGPHTDCRESKS